MRFGYMRQHGERRCSHNMALLFVALAAVATVLRNDTQDMFSAKWTACVILGRLANDCIEIRRN